MPNNVNKTTKKRGYKPRGQRQPIDSSTNFDRKMRRKFKSKKLAKLEVKDELKKLEPDEQRALLKTAKRAIKKERFNEKMTKLWAPLREVELQTPLKPTNTSYSVDLRSYDVFLLEACYDMMDSSIFGKSTGISPQEFRFYCTTLLFSFLMKRGKITGTLLNFVPQIDDSVKVPHCVAKYLEYLAPYRYCGSEQSSEYNYSIDYSATNSAFGVQDSMMLLNSLTSPPTLTPYDYTGYPSFQAFTMDEIPMVQPPVSGTPVGSVYFPNEVFTTALVLSSWMSTPGNLTKVSNALTNCQIPCVDFSWLVGISKKGKQVSAPDASAYCFKTGNALANLSQSSVVSQGGILNLHKNFDPELAMMFMIFRTDPGISSLVSKPLPLPLYDYNVTNSTSVPALTATYPYYCQIGATFIWLSHRVEKLLRGHAKDVLTVCGKIRLRTFYTRGRNVTSATFSTNLAHAYQVIQGLNDQAGIQSNVLLNPNTGPVNVQQGNNANETKLCNNWYIMCSVAFYALQRRFNEQCVHGFNYPIQDSDPSQAQMCMKQLMYVDSTALEVELPPLVARQIDAMGAVVDDDGVLCVPVSSYLGALNSNRQVLNQGDIYPGPISWSAYGFGSNQWLLFPFANISQVNVSNPAAAGTPINQILGNNPALGGQGISLNATFSNNFVGYNTTTFKLYPIFLGGEWMKMYHELYNSFIKSSSLVNSLAKQFIAPENPKLGLAASMLTEVIVANQNAAPTPLIPSNLQLAGPSTTAFNNLLIIRAPIISVNSTMYLGKDKALEALFYAWVQMLDQQVTQDAAFLVVPNILYYVFQTGAPIPSFSNLPTLPQGLLAVTPKSFSGLTTALGDILFKSGNPDSNFSKMKQKVEQAKNQFGQLVPVKMKDAIGKINMDAPWAALCHEVAPLVFGRLQMVPNVTSKSLGPSNAKAPDQVAPVLAVVQSKSGVTSSENEGVQDHPTEKKKERKFNGKRLKKVSGALQSGIKTVGKGLSAALALTNTVGQVSEGDRKSVV